MQFHCYIDARDTVYSSDVEAETPEGAAILAATEHQIAGTWTVVPGRPVEVHVTVQKKYEAQACPLT